MSELEPVDWTTRFIARRTDLRSRELASSPSPQPVLGRTPTEGAAGDREMCPRSSSGYRSPARLSCATRVNGRAEGA